MYPNLDNSMLERVSQVIGDTNQGLTGQEIKHLLGVCRIYDISPNLSKKKRIFNALATKCNQNGSTDIVYSFIQEIFKPARWLDSADGKERMLTKINEVLSLVGILLTEQNEYKKTNKATTISEAKVRAKNLNTKLTNINAHYKVLQCCTEEFLVQDYFHAVHEAAKSLTKRISEETGIKCDGTKLINHAFNEKNPAVVINTLSTDSEKNEYRGIKELLLGINYMVRNVTAHEMRMNWNIDETKAINILTIISSLHRILDECQFIPQQSSD